MELYLNSNRVTDEGVRDIATSLGGSPTLKTLNLSSNRVTEDGAKYLASMLVNPGCRLRNLFLSGALDTTKQLEKGNLSEDEEEIDLNMPMSMKKRKLLKAGTGQFGEMSAGTLAVLEAKRKLARKKGRIGFMGVIYLSTALMAPHGCPLRNLTLVNCDIGPTIEGAKALSVGLYSNDTLEVLNVSDNKIGDLGISLLSESLRVNKKLNNLIFRNCEVSKEMEKKVLDNVRDKSEMDWIEKKDLALVAVEARNWMLTIAQKNNFRFAASAYLEAAKKAEEDLSLNAKLERVDEKMDKKIEETDSKVKKAGLKVIKNLKHKKLEELEKEVEEEKKSSGFGDVVSQESNVSMLPGELVEGRRHKKYDDFTDEMVTKLETFDVAELDAAATGDMLSSCMRLHELCIAESDVCVERIAVLAEQIKRNKKAMGDEEERHKAVTKEAKERMKAEKEKMKELALLKKKLEKDLKPLEAMLREGNEPIAATKLLLVDLENKRGKMRFSKIEKEKAEMTMAEAIMDARSRTNKRGSIVEAKDEPTKDDEEEEPEIIKMTKMRLKVLEDSQDALKGKIAAIKSQISANVVDDEKCNIVVREMTAKVQSSSSHVLSTNKSVHASYNAAVSEAHRLQRRLHSCRVDERHMEARIEELTEETKRKQKEEDFRGLVKETCHNTDMDDELRKAIYDDMQAATLFDTRTSIFKEVKAKYDFDNNSMDMLRFNLKDLERRVGEANEKLGNNLQHWEREKNAKDGVGLLSEWKKAKEKYEKVKGRVEKIENMAYRVEPVPDALVEEFEGAKERFEVLDSEKSAAEQALKDGEPMKIKWGKELARMEEEMEGFEKVYLESKEDYEKVKENHLRKRMIASSMKMDHMALISAEEVSGRQT